MSYLLLTGAGFSRNWGGWLAQEVFEYLIGCEEIAASPALRQLLWHHQQRHLNGFESALAHVQHSYVRNPAPDNGDLHRLQSAISGMFGHMNRNFYRQNNFEWSQNREMSISRFLARFEALFTLNQDQLLEHHYSPELDGPPDQPRFLGMQLPGMATGHMQPPPGARGLAGRMWVARERAEFTVDRGMQPLFKLHGSTGWSDRINERIMILGDNKAREIGMFPILTWYFERFEEYIYRPGTKLMIIGYGFRDPHINDVLIRAVRDHGLEFYVIDPNGSDAARILSPTFGAQIRGPMTDLENAFAAGLIGASRRPLREIFGNDEVEFHKVMRFFQRGA